MGHFKTIGILLSVFLIVGFATFGNGAKVGKSTRIIGGRKAVKNEIPYIVALEETEGQFCGGTIYNKKFIITAAHCFVDPVKGLKIKAGAISVNGAGQVIKVKKVTSHEDYNKATYLNDIAVLELEKELTFNEAVQPIAMAPKGIKPRGKATVSGWGVTVARKDGEHAAPPADDLNTVEVMIVRKSKCDKFYMNVPRKEVMSSYTSKSTTRGVPTPPRTSICAGQMPDGGKDSSSGDSGGPLQCTGKVDGKLQKYLCGIVSSGYGCGMKLPGQYTNVAKFYDWIIEHTKES